MVNTESIVHAKNYRVVIEIFKKKKLLRYHNPEDRFLNPDISVISVVIWETTLTISDFTGEPVSLESGIVRVDSLSTTEISEIKRLKIRS